MVKGLKPNQRYVFALAAYNTKGQIIGKTIGSTSRPILAAHSLPTLMAWGYLAQVSIPRKPRKTLFYLRGVVVVDCGGGCLCVYIAGIGGGAHNWLAFRQQILQATLLGEGRDDQLKYSSTGS